MPYGVHGKGRDGADNRVFLINEVNDALWDYLAKRGDVKKEEPLFKSHSNRNTNGNLKTQAVRVIVAKYLKDAGLKTDSLSAHSLRHTAGTIALLNGAKITSVQTMMRHKSIDTTLAYTRILDRTTDPAENYVSFAG